ncbi:MAG: MbnP family copper-binding protein, partial [Myxococcota bacterium]
TTEQQVEFQLTFNGSSLGCGSRVDDAADGTLPVILIDARIYVSDLRVDGTATPFAVNAFQQEDVALVDFENATDGCESGTADTHESIEFLSAATSPVTLEFQIGVPPSMNHNDPTTAEAPLNVSAMAWPWQRGYKYWKTDFSVGEAPSTAFNVHLGAAGCTSASPTEAPTTPCTFPNLATVRIENFDLTQDAIDIDLAKLLAGLNVSQDAGGAPGCMVAAEDGSECGPIFEALGLDFDTGECTDGCSAQTVFSRVQ